ncbi:hypothetical protein IA01_07295 [Flavobacterium psychrophilum]|uniref:Uncharacterized protein n=1 Tax=Flavobacterium psychrophilum (strain ATCC 49511 / DSM 21280 / CIP 103535 / JIP02/86) TaxID=402612 RepID=A6GZR4_FLAPJ|nr:hypothetical protein [Flavobacterium psychrophilum]AIG30287.1 hypothetical protein IA03_07295 [Flavobacterium psychrophilum]AIG32563.1 hypothetical protein IA01_07295 [Flavobacterium psychrophilum]AIG34718.1 hypothetical protein IA02_06705 [Flavobacterium psychrophilum]AIG37083.1 hypothetical protein IA04_07205 [Flavobacterium psychrophilum]AIG39347.1 hypothetical protein IA05_07290 [Flavobacterium psychrophilum]
MSWLSKEDKSELTKQGLVFFGNIMKEQIENSKSEKAKFIEAKEDGITIEEYNELYDDYDYFSSLVANLLNDAELECEFKKTEVYFLEIIRIIMFDLEKDHKEQIRSFTKAIDNIEFISSYENAIQEREKRLEDEYREILKDYHLKLQQYNQKLKDYNSKNFLSKAFADKPIEPIKPERRK